MVSSQVFIAGLWWPKIGSDSPFPDPYSAATWCLCSPWTVVRLWFGCEFLGPLEAPCGGPTGQMRRCRLQGQRDQR